MDVSKIEAGKLELSLSVENIKRNITQTAIMLKEIAKKKELFLQLIIDPNDPFCCYFDKAKFKQVLINLISNSIKFTEQGGVTVKVDWIHLDPNIREDEQIKNNLKISERKQFIESFNGKYLKITSRI